MINIFLTLIGFPRANQNVSFKKVPKFFKLWVSQLKSADCEQIRVSWETKIKINKLPKIINKLLSLK